MAELNYPPGSLRHAPGGGRYHLLSGVRHAAGAPFLMDTLEPPGAGPPLHMHTREDELFYVLEGTMTFYVDGQVSQLTAGNSLFSPRGIAHCFKNLTDRTVRMLVMCTPGDIEPYFDFGLPAADGAAPTEQLIIERIKATADNYGLRILGPSSL